MVMMSGSKLISSLIEMDGLKVMNESLSLLLLTVRDAHGTQPYFVLVALTESSLVGRPDVSVGFSSRSCQE